MTQFKERKLNTRARYSYVLSAFFHWYNGEKLPLKIKMPKILPQYVPGEDIDRLIDGIKGKKSHKKSIDRDVLLIETARITGLRRGELANLKVGDLRLEGDDPVLIVKQGKGAKDRAVSLNSYIRGQLASFAKGKSQQESVFGLAAKTISLKIGKWARKSGVPHMHTHSLRHYVGTTLFERHANPRAVQAILGHESLDVTMRYVSVIGQDTKQTMELLGNKPADNPIDKEAFEELLEILGSENQPIAHSPEYEEAIARHEAHVKAKGEVGNTTKLTSLLLKVCWWELVIKQSHNRKYCNAIIHVPFWVLSPVRTENHQYLALLFNINPKTNGVESLLVGTAI